MKYLDQELNIYVADFKQNPDIHDELIDADISDEGNIYKNILDYNDSLYRQGLSQNEISILTERGKIHKIRYKNGNDQITNYGYFINRFLLDDANGNQHKYDIVDPSINHEYDYYQPRYIVIDDNRILDPNYYTYYQDFCNKYYTEAICILMAYDEYRYLNSITDGFGISLDYIDAEQTDAHFPWIDTSVVPYKYYYPKISDHLFTWYGDGDLRNTKSVTFGANGYNSNTIGKEDNNDATSIHDSISNLIKAGIVNPYTINLAIKRMSEQEDGIDKWDMYKRWMTHVIGTHGFPVFCWGYNNIFFANDLMDQYFELCKQNPDTEEDTNEIFPMSSTIPYGTGEEEPYSFITQGIITDYIALQWVDGYNEVGQYSLTVPMSQEVQDLLKPGRYLLISDTDKVMIVEKNVFNAALKSDGYIYQSSGRSLESILDRRAAFPGVALNTEECKGNDGLRYGLYNLFKMFFIDPSMNAMEDSSGEKYFYYPERRVEFFDDTFDKDSNKIMKRVFNGSVNKVVSKDSLLKIFMEECQQQNLGFKIIPVQRYGSRAIVWQMQLYTGSDKSYYRHDKNDPLLIFSPNLNNVESVSTTVDETEAKNVIFCGVEKESDSYINLTTVQEQTNPFAIYGENTGIEILDKVNSIQTNVISNVKSKLTTILDNSPVAYTGILYLAISAARKDKDYSPTVESITGYNYQEGNSYIYPDHLLSKEEADAINVTFIKTYGMDETSGGYGNKRGAFIVSNVNIDDASEYDTSFKSSTIYGWLISSILKDAIAEVGSKTFSGIKGIIEKSSLQAWFKTLDKYTSSYSTMKWLCSEYNRNRYATGLDRKEVFVEDEGKDDDEWDASAINQWQTSSPTINVDQVDDDEETDEEIQNRLYDNARKKSADYLEKKEVDANCESENYIYKDEGSSGYDLGDIVQVDDGYGNVEQEIISVVTITNDANSGRKIIPTFKHYNRLPSAYQRLEYIRVANMILPCKFNKMSTVLSNASGLDKEYYPYYVRYEDNDSYHAYTGNITDIYSELQHKITEIELAAKYTKYGHQNAQEDVDLVNNFPMISAIGREDFGINFYKNLSSCGITDLTHVIPFMLLNTRLVCPSDSFDFAGSYGLGNDPVMDNENRYIDCHINDNIISLYCNASQDTDLNSKIIYYYGGNYNGIPLYDSDTDKYRIFGGPGDSKYRGDENDYSIKIDDYDNDVYYINKLVLDSSNIYIPKIENDKLSHDHDKEEESYKFIYSTFSSSLNSGAVSKRLLSDVFYLNYTNLNGNITVVNKFVNEGASVNKQGYCINDANSPITDNTLKKYYNNHLHKNRIVLDTNTYGQVNSDYMWLKQGDSNNLPDYDFIQTYQNNGYYRNLVLGGYAFINYRKQLEFLTGTVDSDITVSEDGRIQKIYHRHYPELNDINNGIKVKYLNVYEYDASLRQVAYKNQSVDSQLNIVENDKNHSEYKNYKKDIRKNILEIDITDSMIYKDSFVYYIPEYADPESVNIRNKYGIVFFVVDIGDKIKEYVDSNGFIKDLYICINSIDAEIPIMRPDSTSGNLDNLIDCNIRSHVKYFGSSSDPPDPTVIDKLYFYQSFKPTTTEPNPTGTDFGSEAYVHFHDKGILYKCTDEIYDDITVTHSFRIYTGSLRYMTKSYKNSIVVKLLYKNFNNGYQPSSIMFVNKGFDGENINDIYTTRTYKLYIDNAGKKYLTQNTSINDNEKNRYENIKIRETIEEPETPSTPTDIHYDSSNDSLYQIYQIDAINSNAYIADYPNLASRKLVHEYIPVEYINYRKENEPDNRERFGLYDLIDQEFVPINYGNNSFATYIDHGGIIKNE